MNKIFQVAGSGPDGHTSLIAEIPVRNSALSFNECEGLFMSVAQIKTIHDIRRQPIAPEDNDERAGALLKVRFRQSGFSTELDHPLGT